VGTLHIQTTTVGLTYIQTSGNGKNVDWHDHPLSQSPYIDLLILSWPKSYKLLSQVTLQLRVLDMT
jgi:hypothetical protein